MILKTYLLVYVPANLKRQMMLHSMDLQQNNVYVYEIWSKKKRLFDLL